MTDLLGVPSATAAFARRFPEHVGAARMYGEDYHRDVAALHRDLRARHGAVAPALLDGDIPLWLVLGYREAHYVLTHSELFDRQTPWNALDLIPPDWSHLWLLGNNEGVMRAEGAEHERRSAVVHDALNAVDHFELRARCESFADELIDEFGALGEAELMSRYVYRLPAAVLTWMVGISRAEAPAMVRDFVRLLEFTPDALEAHQRLLAGMGRLIEDRRVRPAFDVASRMVNHPRAPSDHQLVQDLQLIVGAGLQPTAHWIGNTLRLLLTDARFATSLAGGRRSVRQAMGEVLWEDPPAPNLTARWAARPSQLGRYRLQTGDLVVLAVAAAQADPHIRPDPLAGVGGNQAHLAFSHGPHRCPFPAQEAAEVIAETAVEVLLDRLPDLTLAVPPEHLRWQETVWVRGLTGLPVVFTPV
jgi:cytochrome P450